MIGDGKFKPQLEAIEKVLKTLGLFSERQLFPGALGVAELKGKSYREAYDLLFRELAYNFRLSDQALLFFNRTGQNIHDGSLSFCYYEAPILVLPYGAFVGLQLGISSEHPDFENALQEWGDEWKPDYEDYVRSSDLKVSVTPLRYDCKAADYRPGLHPAGHMHFGIENEIRLGVRRVMTPLAFVLFVIRQRYPTEWANLLTWRNCEQVCRNVRAELELVDEAYWSANDEKELFLA